MKRLLILAVCLTTCAHCAAQQDVDNLVAESNPAIQQQLEAISRVIRPSESVSSNVEALREIQKLKELTDDEAELVKQVAIFAMAPGEETQPMLAGAILNTWGCGAGSRFAHSRRILIQRIRSFDHSSPIGSEAMTMPIRSMER
jgi:hypothetical protein